MKKFTRYYRDPQFRNSVNQEFELADVASESASCVTYAIHDPTRVDHIEGRVEGLIIYVGQSKEFGKRVRKRMRSAGTAVRRPTDRIDGACYDIMSKGVVPRFTVLEHCACVLDSLVSETNWTKRLRKLGYPLLNQWTEQKFVGVDTTRSTVPHAWLWPITAADALASRIDLIVHDGSQSLVADLTTFPVNMRLREIRDLMKSTGRNARLQVHDLSL